MFLKNHVFCAGYNLRKKLRYDIPTFKIIIFYNPLSVILVKLLYVKLICCCLGLFICYSDKILQQISLKKSGPLKWFWSSSSWKLRFAIIAINLRNQYLLLLSIFAWLLRVSSNLNLELKKILLYTIFLYALNVKHLNKNNKYFQNIFTLNI